MDAKKALPKALPINWPPLIFLLYQLLVVLVLVVAAFAFTRESATLPRFNWDHVLPLWVPWAGALGGSAISLVGVAEHSADWDGNRYAHWHLMRPFLGMITGTVGVLALLFVLKGIAPDVIPAANESYSAGGVAVMFVIAFVVGYREETFREMVKRVVDVILGPGEKEKSQRLALVPAVLVLTHDRSGGAATVTGTITLLNDSKDTFDITTAKLDITGASFNAVWEETSALEPATARGITITWTPGTMPVSAEEIVTVGVGGYSLTSRVRATVI